MKRVDFYDWMIAHGCKVEVLKEWNSGRAIKIVNPKTDRYIFLDLPIDNKSVQAYYVCKSCLILGVPIPDACKNMEDLANHIKDKHYPKFY